MASLSADSVLFELGMDEPEDIDVELVAAEFNAAVLYEEQVGGCAACLVGYGNKAIISVEKNTPIERQRFSIGHELAHWLFDREKQVFHCKESTLLEQWAAQSIETRANRFASDLILPRRLFEPRAQNLDPTFESVEVLRRKFNASLTATAIKFVECSSYSCMLCCYVEGHYKWCVRSEFFPERLWPRSLMSSGTLASKAHEKTISAAPVSVNCWFDDPRISNGRIIEDSRYSKSLRSTLSLLWWREKFPILDDDEEEQWFDDDD